MHTSVTQVILISKIGFLVVQTASQHYVTTASRANVIYSCMRSWGSYLKKVTSY